uniref:small monomeric GTPase n=1 Tax=Anolis carolinensis TaxID=28377 RepID=R4G9W2_ANOCA
MRPGQWKARLLLGGRDRRGRRSEGGREEGEVRFRFGPMLRPSLPALRGHVPGGQRRGSSEGAAGQDRDGRRVLRGQDLHPPALHRARPHRLLHRHHRDTAGQERFHTFTTSFFRGAHGFVLVYDVTSTESFQGIAHWMKDIYEKTDETINIILLGNKCDKEMERVIPKNRGEKLAWEYGIPFFETSAKDNINIDDAFSVLAEEILNKSSCVLLDVDVVDLYEKAQKKACCRL